MTRRPLHLRWMYIRDHPWPFSTLVLATLLALAVVAVLLSDPVRGLMLGAVPVAAGGLGWTMTNRAGYPDREPVSLPHERLHFDTAAGARDPFGRGEAKPQTTPAPPRRRKRPWDDDEAEQPRTGAEADDENAAPRSPAATPGAARRTSESQPTSGSPEPSAGDSAGDRTPPSPAEAAIQATEARKHRRNPA